MAAIYTNTSALTVYKNYNRNQMALSSSMEKLATGLKINRGSDDAAGLAISENLRGQIAGTNKAVDNIANATNFINVADGYLQTVHGMLGRMEELGVEMGDATKTSSDKGNISSEYNALKGEIDNVFANGKFNGQAIFGTGTQNFVVDANGNSNGVFSLDSAAVASFSSTAISTIAATSDATTAVSQIQSAIQTISAQRAALGANQSQLNFKSQGLQNYSENVSAAESRIRDVDVAAETTNFSRQQILVQASTSMLAQANSLPQGVLKLLG